MILKYLQVLKNVYEGIGKEGREFSFYDYLSSILMGIGMLLMVAFFVVLIIGSVAVPVITYKKIVGKIAWERECMAGTYDTKDKIQVLTKKLHRRVVAFITIMIFYFPVVISTILYVVYLMFHI